MAYGEQQHGTMPGDGLARAILSAAAVAALLTVGGMLAGFLSGHEVLSGHHDLAGGVLALGHVHDPSLGWQTAVGPAWAYWTVTIGVFVLVGGAAYAIRRRVVEHGRDEPIDVTKVKGLAERGEIVRVAGARALVARGATLRPSLAKPTASQLGFRLGTSRNVECYSSVEDSIVILGPPRSGKGHNLVIPMILDAPGPVISTSTRPKDAVTPTLGRRSQIGPVGVFDPQGLAHGVPSSLKWSPIRGCEQPQTAMLRALALCSGAAKGVTEGEFWLNQTVTAVRCLLHAAALDSRPPADLYRWSLSAPAASEAVNILSTTPGAARSWDRALDAIISADMRLRDNVWSMVASVFGALADPQVLAAVTPNADDEFDPVRFLRKNGTLYLLSTAAGASATVGLVAALVEDVVETARRLAAASPEARLDPPLSLILDEAANYPLPSLAALMSEGGGSGITTIAVLQSLAQARDRWGVESAQAIWDSAIAKIILGGSSSASDMRDVSQLIGEREYQDVSTSTHSDGKRSTNRSTQRRDILEPANLRLLRQGHALLMLRSARPILLEMRPWTARKDFAELDQQKQHNEALIRTGAIVRWGNDA
jgi:type IV secretion system protein VirD4